MFYYHSYRKSYLFCSWRFYGHKAIAMLILSQFKGRGKAWNQCNKLGQSIRNKNTMELDYRYESIQSSKQLMWATYQHARSHCQHDNLPFFPHHSYPLNLLAVLASLARRSPLVDRHHSMSPARCCNSTALVRCRHWCCTSVDDPSCCCLHPPDLPTYCRRRLREALHIRIVVAVRGTLFMLGSREEREGRGCELWGDCARARLEGVVGSIH